MTKVSLQFDGTLYPKLLYIAREAGWARERKESGAL